MRHAATTCCVAAVLAALCVSAVVAQEIGNEKPRTKGGRQPVKIELQPSMQQPAPQATTPPESYLPTTDELEKVEIDPRLLRCIDRLGDPTWDVREEATVELMNGRFVKREVYAALARLDLSCEQRHRLLTAVQDNLLSTPRGAVGISVDRRFTQDGKIIVKELLPDLPARQVLRRGDRITHLHGEPLANWEAFVKEVQTRKPGSKISVTVQRIVSARRPNRREIAAQEPKYKTVQVEIELGSAEMLRDPISGQVQRTGDVYQSLQDEANEAAGTFGPSPRLLELDEEDAAGQ